MYEEHSSREGNMYGSERAFESLPVFANRATLEHAYFQASPSSPFVFYIQFGSLQRVPRARLGTMRAFRHELRERRKASPHIQYQGRDRYF